MDETTQKLTESERAKYFSVKHAFGLFGLYFGLQMAVVIGIGMVLGMFWGIRHFQDKSGMTPEAVQGFLKPFEPMMALIGTVLSLVVCFTYARKWSAEFWKSREGVGWVLPMYPQSFTQAAIVGAVCGLLVMALTSYFPMSTSIEQTPLGTFVNNGFVGFVIFAILALIFAPIGEEIVFRGFMLGAMRRRWGIAVSVLVSSLIFGTIHLPQTFTYWPAILATFALGLVCAIIRVRTESILTPMLTHAVYNIFPVLGALKIVLEK